MYDEKGRLTRAGAEAVIRGGGSVSFGGQIINSVDKLPDEAAFARGDDKAEAAAKERLRQQIADAQRQLDALDKPAAATTPAGPSEPPKPVEIIDFGNPAASGEASDATAAKGKRAGK